MDIAKRITGISTPIFGVSWYPKMQERNIAIKLIIFLEDRRVLYNPVKDENFEYVIASVLKIRERLTRDMELLDRSSELMVLLTEMRRTCRKFLDVNQKYKFDFPLKNKEERNNFEKYLQSIMIFRENFGRYIALLSIKYGIDLAYELQSILPKTPIEKKLSTEKTIDFPLKEYIIDGKHIILRGIFKRSGMFEAPGNIIVKGSIECDTAFSARGDVIATSDSYTRSLGVEGNLIILGKYENWKEDGYINVKKNILVAEFKTLGGLDLKCGGNLIVAGDLDVDYAEINGNLIVGGNINDEIIGYYGNIVGPTKIDVKGSKYIDRMYRPIILDKFYEIGRLLINQSDKELPKLDHLIENFLELFE